MVHTRSMGYFLCFILLVSAPAGPVSDPAPPRHLQESTPRSAHLHFFRPGLLLRHRQLGTALHGQAGATPVLHLAGRCPDNPHPHSPPANNTRAVPPQPGEQRAMRGPLPPPHPLLRTHDDGTQVVFVLPFFPAPREGIPHDSCS